MLQTEVEYARSVIRDLPVNRQLFLTLVTSPYISVAAREYIMQLSPCITTLDTMTCADILVSHLELRQELLELRMIYEMKLCRNKD